MRNLKKILLVVLFLLLVATVLIFVLENQQAVSLLFLGWAGPQLPVSAVVVITLLMGMLLGPLVGWIFGVVFRARRNRPV